VRRGDGRLVYLQKLKKKTAGNQNSETAYEVMMNEKGPVEGRKSRVTIALAAYRRSKPGIDHISQIQEPRHVEAMHIGRAGTARAQESFA